MTSISYFVKMNSTLGSVVPLAMFVVVVPKGTVVTIIDLFMNILS